MYLSGPERQALRPAVSDLRGRQVKQRSFSERSISTQRSSTSRVRIQSYLSSYFSMESLILAQDERWRRA